MGIQILNPIQWRCNDWDLAALKEQYGDKLCFHSAVDNQQTLPFGTPLDVKEEVLTRMRTIGRGGGLIIGPTHNLQLDTPLENFWSLVDTVRETTYASLHAGALQ